MKSDSAVAFDKEEKGMIRVEDLTVLQLGTQGDDQLPVIDIDVSSLKAKWPNATYDVLIRRPGQAEADAYAASTALTGNVLKWTVAAADVSKPGYGYAQVAATYGTGHWYGPWFSIEVRANLGGGTASSTKPWVSEVLEAKTAAAASATAAAASATSAANAAAHVVDVLKQVVTPEAYTGTDVQRIRAAIAACPAGGTVKLTKAEYVITFAEQDEDAITLKSNMTITSDIRSVITTRGNTVWYKSIFYIPANAENVKITNLVFDQRGDNVQGVPADQGHVNLGIIDGSGSETLNNIEVSNCEFYQFGAQSIYVSSSRGRDLVVRDNIVKFFRKAGFKENYDCTAINLKAKNIVCSGNVITTKNGDRPVECAIESHSGNSLCSGNVISSCGNAFDILMDVSGANSAWNTEEYAQKNRGVMISNNKIHDANYAFVIWSKDPASYIPYQNLTIEGNSVSNVCSAVVTYNSDSGQQACKDITICDNTFSFITGWSLNEAIATESVSTIKRECANHTAFRFNDNTPLQNVRIINNRITGFPFGILVGSSAVEKDVCAIGNIFEGMLSSSTTKMPADYAKEAQVYEYIFSIFSAQNHQLVLKDNRITVDSGAAFKRGNIMNNAAIQLDDSNVIMFTGDELLRTEADMIEAAVFEGRTVTSIAGYAVRRGAIRGELTWSVISTNEHVAIPVTRGEAVSITANADHVPSYAFLQSYVPPINNESAVLSSAEGYDQLLNVARGRTATYTVPDDVHWLIVMTKKNGNDTTPSAITITGTPIMDDLRTLKASTQVASVSDWNTYKGGGN